MEQIDKSRKGWMLLRYNRTILHVHCKLVLMTNAITILQRILAVRAYMPCDPDIIAAQVRP